MNLAYFRKSNFSLEETVKNVSDKAREDGWKILGVAPLPEGSGNMVLLCRTDWVKTLMEKDHNLIGFLPCAVSVFKKGTDVLVGTGQPAVIKAVSQNPDISAIAAEAENRIKELVNFSAGVGDLVPTKVKLYSTLSCPYCKMEQAWLEQNKVEHEVIHVDLNQKAAEEMVQKTGQMGVPVTEIQYENSDSEYIIGFNKPQLAQILGVRE